MGLIKDPWSRTPVPTTIACIHLSAVARPGRQGAASSVVRERGPGTFVCAHEHYETEQFLRSTGIAFTFLRPGLYADNVPKHVMSDDVIRAPAGQGRVAWIAREDIAGRRCHDGKRSRRPDV